MSDERKGKLEYVQDNVSKEKITVSELEDLLNELVEENKQLKKKLESLQKILHLVEVIDDDCYCSEWKIDI